MSKIELEDDNALALLHIILLNLNPYVSSETLQNTCLEADKPLSLKYINAVLTTFTQVGLVKRVGSQRSGLYKITYLGRFVYEMMNEQVPEKRDLLVRNIKNTHDIIMEKGESLLTTDKKHVDLHELEILVGSLSRRPN